MDTSDIDRIFDGEDDAELDTKLPRRFLREEEFVDGVVETGEGADSTPAASDTPPEMIAPELLFPEGVDDEES